MRSTDLFHALAVAKMKRGSDRTMLSLGIDGWSV